MKTLREKIEKANTDACDDWMNAIEKHTGIIAMGQHIAFKKTLQWLDEEEKPCEKKSNSPMSDEKSFEEQVNGMNYEADAADYSKCFDENGNPRWASSEPVDYDIITAEYICNLMEEIVETKTHDYVPNQLCPKCNGNNNSLFTCCVCNGKGVIPMHEK